MYSVLDWVSKWLRNEVRLQVLDWKVWTSQDDSKLLADTKETCDQQEEERDSNTFGECMSSIWEVKQLIQYVAVTVPELVNLRVKQRKCANACAFTSMVAPCVAKGGSVFLRAGQGSEARFVRKIRVSPVGPRFEKVGRCVWDCCAEVAEWRRGSLKRWLSEDLA